MHRHRGRSRSIGGRPQGAVGATQGIRWTFATGRRRDATAADPTGAFALSRLDDVAMAHVPIGIFRDVERPTYDDLVRGQVTDAQQALGGRASDEDLATLLAGTDTWTVAAP
jgi:hypothetical protein